MNRTLAIFHTNDFHNGLNEELAEKIALLRKQDSSSDTLLVDAGDAIKAGNIGVNPFGEPILERMSRFGWDAMTLGNREFHVSEAALRLKINRASFPILCANIRFKNETDTSLPVLPHVVIETKNKLRVGIVGVTVPMVTSRMAAKALSAFLFENPVEIAIREAETLADETDVLILLSHIGYKKDLEIASKTTKYDLIIGGHSHTLLYAADISTGTPIVQTGSHAKRLGRVLLEERDGNWALADSKLIDLSL
jgi:2',3'-cyclic-nucleotide 2'-phosphodiesterase (5'-nucleotidase family)